MREDEIKRLIRILEENEGIEEIEMAIFPFGARKIRISRRGKGMPAVAPIPHSADLQAPVAQSEEASGDQAQSDLHAIKAPMVGTFYRASSPDEDPLVQEGTRIGPGSVLCIIEAMKLMNEIESDISGTVREIVVENGTPVEFGQTIFLIERD